jgi:hypothetical protein
MLYTHPSLILLPLPRASNEGDEQEAQATTAQQTHMIRAAVPVPPSVEAVMTSTRMIGSTYTGKEILGISMIPSDQSPVSQAKNCFYLQHIL